MGRWASARRPSSASCGWNMPAGCWRTSARRITDISLDAGFADTAHLSREFKAAFGRSPREFRRAVARPA